VRDKEPNQDGANEIATTSTTAIIMVAAGADILVFFMGRVRLYTHRSYCHHKSKTRSRRHSWSSIRVVLATTAKAKK